VLVPVCPRIGSLHGGAARICRRIHRSEWFWARPAEIVDHFWRVLELLTGLCIFLRTYGRGPGGDVIQSKSQIPRPQATSLRLVTERSPRTVAARPPTDAELVRALRADDPAAPAILWARCSPAVGRLLAKVLGPGLEIEDLTQEVFLRVFVRLPSLREPSALKAFVLSVATNVLKWELRRRWVSRRVRLSISGRLPDIAGTSNDAEARQALRRCYQIFDSLTTKERLAFVLRYLEGMTIEEVAATLAVSVSTAKRWVGSGAGKVADRVSRDPDLRSFFAKPREEGPS